MALSTYTELKTAVANEINRDDSRVTDAVADFIKRAEAKINRTVRLREMEQLAYTTYTSASRYVQLPSDYVEILNLRIKKATAEHKEYTEVEFVPSNRINEFYGSASDASDFVYTLRDELEINIAPVTDHTLMIHYLKAWDIATDSTNWLLTHYPDAYLYGALCEAEGFVLRDKRIPLWKSLFKEAMDDLNKLSERGRDDERYELDTSQVSRLAGRGTFNILTG